MARWPMTSWPSATGWAPSELAHPRDGLPSAGQLEAKPAHQNLPVGWRDEPGYFAPSRSVGEITQSAVHGEEGALPGGGPDFPNEGRQPVERQACRPSGRGAKGLYRGDQPIAKGHAVQYKVPGRGWELGEWKPR